VRRKVLTTRTEPIYQRIGQRLRDALVEARLNQEQLAERLDVSGSLVNQWVNGQRRIQVEDLRRVAAALDVPVVRLLGEDAGETVPPPGQQVDLLAERVVAQLTERLPAIVRAVLLETGAPSHQPTRRALARQASSSTDYGYLNGGGSAPMGRLVRAAAPVP
jgi:transcriptional regulator with XRE-family HTH domain